MYRCMGCMELIADDIEYCSNCGYIRGSSPLQEWHLKPESILNERYIIGRVLGYGGFGVTYLELNYQLSLSWPHLTKCV